MDIQLRVEGMAELQSKMEQVAKDLVGQPMVEGMRQATLLVTRDARLLAPVDTGRLKNSIVPDLRVVSDTVIGVVGTNVRPAPYVEFGTKPHFPPLDKLQVWASRHGTTAYAVARGIAAHGTKAHHYLQGAFDKNQQQIKDLIGNVVSSIVQK